jgi:hypothetical protein
MDKKAARKGHVSMILFFLFTACCLVTTGLMGCTKKEKEALKEDTQFSVVEKNTEVTSSVEAASPEITADTYKGVLVVSSVEGVDWQKGVITAVGRGLLPKDVANPSQAKLIAMRAAKMEAYKNLLETILKMKTPPDRGMKEYLEEKHIQITRIEGFVKGAMVVKEEYKNDGSAEVTLAVPITGEKGLLSALK